MTRHFYTGTLALALGVAACGGEDLVLPSEGEPAEIAVVQGDGQSGRVGEALPQPLVFEVTDIAGRPVASATVVVTLAGAQLDPETVTTDGNGLATVGVVLGGTVGSVQGSAAVVTPEDQPGVQVGFTVSAVAASANGLAIVSGQDQVAAAGSALPEPLMVQVTDAFGNPIEGVTIAWTAEGGGTLSAPSSVTDAGGLASVLRTLGPTAGSQRTLATSEGLAGSPAAFLHTATPGSAAGVQIVGGDGQQGPPGARLPADLAVRVTDADGNPITGAAVTWVVTGGGGTMDPATSTTDANGQATTGWTLGPQVGANTAQAVVSGVGSASFTATAVAGSASRIEIVSGNGQSAPAGQTLPTNLVVRVVDGSGNAVPAATVQWQVRSGGGSVAPLVGATDASGQASAAWTLGGTAGANTLEATVSGVGSVTFNATATVGAPSALALRTQPDGSAEAGVPFDRQPVVQLRDATGNDVAQSGVAVTAAIASGDGTLTGTVTRSTDGNGRATFTDLEIGGATGAHTLI
ncbi:MAG TPA: Ig-like domain-containing protein, partial [Gemmatimonadales bacterium]|nr:Ig-like domain-containing protein [Gemmatimonadales bacterium]